MTLESDIYGWQYVGSSFSVLTSSVVLVEQATVKAVRIEHAMKIKNKSRK